MREIKRGKGITSWTAERGKGEKQVQEMKGVNGNHEEVGKRETRKEKKE